MRQEIKLNLFFFFFYKTKETQKINSLSPVRPQRVRRGAQVVPRDLGGDVVRDVDVDVVAEELDQRGVVAVDLEGWKGEKKGA